ncbi:hypothetical protein E1B28_003705 [Marasmius oreades]|uniref:Uncharacterized protein n=1 Tax=Marasmius oreades TaxID=181124 RepID=A0A9P7UX33_9AGAR|nr:uncharacterized protein E1B28_003705 [Marasmius oreades]KAG7096257.1 hypothetical protein E1B28_003705 [Marasmius oreades]
MPFFEGASEISIRQPVFNEVGRDQVNNHYHVIQEEKQYTIYDEFRTIRLGDVEMIQKLGDVTFRKQGGVLRTTFTATVHSGQGSKCTVLSYSGPDAEEQWERDFRQISGLQCVQNIPGDSPELATEIHK